VVEVVILLGALAALVVEELAVLVVMQQQEAQIQEVAVVALAALHLTLPQAAQA
jgi:hypothetical protein